MEQKLGIDSGRPLILVTVVNRGKADSIMDMLHAFEVNLQTAIPATGTATVERMALLGLDDPDKTVILSVIREDRAADALSAIEKRFQRIRNGKGIAFTLPMSSLIGVSVFRFFCNDRTKEQNK
jgi:hypothetical protein